MSRRRLNRPGVSGVFTSTSARQQTLREAYGMAKKNDGAPGVDGVTFEAIEAQGADALLEQIRDELIGAHLQTASGAKAGNTEAA